MFQHRSQRTYSYSPTNNKISFCCLEHADPRAQLSSLWENTEDCPRIGRKKDKTVTCKIKLCKWQTAKEINKESLSITSMHNNQQQYTWEQATVQFNNDLLAFDALFNFNMWHWEAATWALFQMFTPMLWQSASVKWSWCSQDSHRLRAEGF